MREDEKLTMNSQVWRVVYATADQVPELRENEGWTDFATNTIYLRKALLAIPSRARDVKAHEIGHAYLETSGIGNFLQDNYAGHDYDKFEETLIRLFVPSFLRLIEDNGAALIALPALIDALAKKAAASSPSSTRVKKAKRAVR